MSRIPTPPNIESAPSAAQPLLQAVKKQLGVVPNLFRLVATSPAALEGYLSMSGALAKGELPAPTRERIALAVAEINGCGYCLSAHTYLGKNVAKLDDAELAANQAGGSLDPKANAAVRFAVKVTEQRGHVSEADLKAVKDAGYSDAQVIEIVQHVALNTWTNYLNVVAQTDIDFPVVKARAAA
jgi:uncharacterized peroxidase-related enzyme